MLLTKDEIRSANLIDPATFKEECLFDMGYDLRIETFISRGADQKMRTDDDEAWIDPQGIVAAVSKEIVRLPAGICAYASVKTGLCRDGILAINIGIVDPGWNAPISSVLLNFGKERLPIKAETAFLRLTFHRVGSGPQTTAPARGFTSNRQDYENAIQRKFEQRLASSFMDFEKAAEKGSQRFSEGIRSTLLKYIPIGALMLGVLTFLLNYGVLSIAARAIPQDVVKLKADALIQEERAEHKKETDALKQQLLALQNQILELEKRLKPVKP